MSKIDIILLSGRLSFVHGREVGTEIRDGREKCSHHTSTKELAAEGKRKRCSKLELQK